MSLIAKNVQNKNSETTGNGVQISTLILALRSGEERIKKLKQMAYGLPAAQGAAILNELKPIENILKAVGKELDHE